MPSKQDEWQSTGPSMKTRWRAFWRLFRMTQKYAYREDQNGEPIDPGNGEGYGPGAIMDWSMFLWDGDPTTDVSRLEEWLLVAERSMDQRPRHQPSLSHLRFMYKYCPVPSIERSYALRQIEKYKERKIKEGLFRFLRTPENSPPCLVVPFNEL